MEQLQITHLPRSDDKLDTRPICWETRIKRPVERLSIRGRNQQTWLKD